MIFEVPVTQSLTEQLVILKYVISYLLTLNNESWLYMKNLYQIYMN